MARAWSGFLPQNESIKRQWNLLEAPASEIAESLQTILHDLEKDSGSELGAEEENFEFFRMNKTREASGS